ncbi:hypothetical protein GUITHDRAFT_85698 [Guillardia theta CCMP2712]|uniref:Enoyl reductase (ER) domain-containing protein n=1 Tax=Guillardia theta (strain CCMP2712) TaxID=905079 RepID=L1JLZ8_GUITC|nr:hypothetical protein GUITHDRAFT_85698 [Guillardia theta CCMP2712]EKX49229.1 hypothetical protein GUITHDRAFT_85698 [Guillardia theta CCMP2712]|eukprot:XP_005836209.1 hypothetical protein GUITHDRAFT_85698 [Guillardia theta CCMP2712]
MIPALKSSIIWRSFLVCLLSRPSQSFISTKLLPSERLKYFHNIQKRLQISCTRANSESSNIKLPNTYRALWADKAGSSFREVVVLREKEFPQISSDEVLIEVKYAGVNGGCETFRARGEHWFARNRESAVGFPLGAEGVGKVVQKGKDVAEVEVGDSVAFVGGAFSEYVVHKSESVVKVVPAANPEAVACRISGLTAYGAVLDAGRAAPRQTILITAAAGAAGSFAVQFAKQAGCNVIGTCSSKEKAQVLCKLGCDHIINYKTRNLDEFLRSKFPEGVDLVIEHVGGQMFRTAFSHLKPGGRLVLVGYISEVCVSLTVFFSYRNYFFHHTNQSCLAGKRYWEFKRYIFHQNCLFLQVFEQLGADSLKVLVDSKHFEGLENIADAVDHMLSGKTVGKVVVKIS